MRNPAEIEEAMAREFEAGRTKEYAVASEVVEHAYKVIQTLRDRGNWTQEQRQQIDEQLNKLTNYLIPF